MIGAIYPLPFARLVTARRGYLAPAAWTALVVVSALHARDATAASVDRVLLGAYSDFALPFLALSLVAIALGGRDLARAGEPLARLGAPPARVALVHVGVAALACAAAGALLGALGLALAHRPESPPFAADLAATLYAGALGGAAYAAMFVFASSFGGGRAARGVALVADFVLGAGSGTGALLVPRGHVRNLLGEHETLALSARASGIVLLTLVFVYAALSALRVRRA